jgi:hypothetical protein
VVAGSAKAAVSVEDLRREVEDLRKRLADKNVSGTIGRVDAAAAKKYGPNAPVSTKTGKLEIGGLLQLWNYNRLDDDHNDVFGTGTSEARDNQGYGVRRTELRFSIDIHENISAFLMIDPAQETASLTPIPSNQGLFKSRPFVSPEFDAVNGPGLGSTSEIAAVQTGAGRANTLLQDAYINYHGVVPHHDFQLGQFRPPMGEEGTRDSGYLDFVERAMVTQLNETRDLGLQVHGTWWNDRFQYWAGVFNSAGNFFGTAGNFSNRSDDNDEKDFAGRLLVRPIWNCGPWGSLELGYAGQFGRHGEAAGADPVNTPVNGLNRDETAAIRQAAWFMYKPMGPVRGWWLRGEWGYQKDRATPLSVGALALGSGDNGEQTSPNPFSRQGWFVSTGYKLNESVFADRLSKGGFWNKLMQPVEFVFRYESFSNIITEDLVQPDTHTDVFNTRVFTGGVNYYIVDYKYRVQVNYMNVNERENKINNAARNFEEVNNDVLMFSYQILF